MLLTLLSGKRLDCYYSRCLFCNLFCDAWCTEIVDFCEFLSPTPEEKAARDMAIASVSDVIKHIWPHCQVYRTFSYCILLILLFVVFYVSMKGHCRCFQVEVFGSFRTGLYLPTSDIDVSSIDIVMVNLPYELVHVAD